MLQVTIDLEVLDEESRDHTFDVVSIGHYEGECIITYVDKRLMRMSMFHAISTGSVFFKGLA